MPVLVVDGWLPLRVPPGADGPLLVLRARLDATAKALRVDGEGTVSRYWFWQPLWRVVIRRGVR